MIISSNFNQNFSSSPSFSSLNLYPVKLKKITRSVEEEIVPAYFSQLTKEDIPFIQKIQNLWSKTTYGKFILPDFLRIEKFGSQLDKSENLVYMIEKKDEKDLNLRSKAFANVRLYPDSMEVSFVQTLASQVPLERLLGAGTAIMYGICKQAQEMGLDKLFLMPSNLKTAGWYRRLGMDNALCFCSLPSEKFSTFQKNIEKKFNY